MSNEGLPSIDDFAEDLSNLPSIDDYLTEEVSEELPSVSEFIVEEKEEIEEAKKNYPDYDGDSHKKADVQENFPNKDKMEAEEKPYHNNYEHVPEDLDEELSFFDKMNDEADEQLKIEKDLKNNITNHLSGPPE